MDRQLLEEDCSCPPNSICRLMDPGAGCIGGVDGAVVAQQRQREQELLQRFEVTRPPREQRRALRVEHDEVGFRARDEIADRAFQVHAARGAQRGQIKHPQSRQITALEPRNFIRFIHCLQHREGRAGADIADTT